MPRTLIAVIVLWGVLTFGLLTAIAGAERGRGGEIVTNAWRAPTARPVSAVTADHIEQHRRMTGQMRAAGPDARMQAHMAHDPMWAMMFDLGHIRAEEELQRQIDRMLARGG